MTTFWLSVLSGFIAVAAAPVLIMCVTWAIQRYRDRSYPLRVPARRRFTEHVFEQLCHVPTGILWLASRLLPKISRAETHDQVWFPELAYQLRGTEERQLTRLAKGFSLSLGLLVSTAMSAARIALKARLALWLGIGIVIAITAGVTFGSQYLDRHPDPVALFSLIIAIATLAGTIYNDRKHTSVPPPGTIARQVSITLATRTPPCPPAPSTSPSW